MSWICGWRRDLPTLSRRVFLATKSWLSSIYPALAMIYAALKEPDKAAKFESEMAKGRNEVVASVAGEK